MSVTNVPTIALLKMIFQRAGTAAYVTRMVPCVNSLVRLMTHREVNSNNETTPVPVAMEPSSLYDMNSGSGLNKPTRLEMTTGNTIAMMSRTQCDRTVRAFSHSLEMIALMTMAPSGTPGHFL